MTVVYLIPPGVRVAASFDGADFKVQTSPQLQFIEPPELAVR